MVEGVEDSGWKNHLMTQLRCSWQDELHTDLLITTADGDIPVHKIVVAAASPYFK